MEQRPLSQTAGSITKDMEIGGATEALGLCSTALVGNGWNSVRLICGLTILLCG
jgi:hypothetical protein